MVNDPVAANAGTNAATRKESTNRLSFMAVFLFCHFFNTAIRSVSTGCYSDGEMAQVFISYAHVSPDQDFAAQLAGYLEANGFCVFVDSKIRVGQDWVEQIDRQLRNSEYFIVLLSPASIQSDMLRREIAIAHKLRKSKQLTIFPVRLHFEGELPYEMGAYLDLIQYTAWTQGQSFDPICHTILQAMSGSAELAAVPAPILPGRFDATELDRVKRELAVYVGPVARLILEQAAKRAADWRQLYEILAAEIPAGEERKRFLATRPR